MKFEEIESAWALQQPAKTDLTDLPALRRALKSQLNRRKRMLILGASSLVLSLGLMQALFFINLRVMLVGDQWLSFARLMVHQTFWPPYRAGTGPDLPPPPAASLRRGGLPNRCETS